jgi:hypothetical protein
MAATTMIVDISPWVGALLLAALLAAILSTFAYFSDACDDFRNRFL